MVLNIPNSLTLLRLFLVPLLTIAVIYREFELTLTLFLLAAVTDLLDGLFARLLKQRTLLGLYLDPAADKMLVLSCYLSLAFIGLVPAWLMVVVIFKDLFMILGAAIIFSCGWELKVEPSPLGKQTTFLQLFSVAVVLLFAVTGRQAPWLDWLFFATGLLTFFSGGHYIFRRLRTLPDDASLPG
jgi:cardiolipin synthase